LAGARHSGSDEVVLMVMRQMHRVWSVRLDEVVVSVVFMVGEVSDMLLQLLCCNLNVEIHARRRLNNDLYDTSKDTIWITLQPHRNVTASVYLQRGISNSGRRTIQVVALKPSNTISSDVYSSDWERSPDR
jgi:hypothetical protein